MDPKTFSNMMEQQRQLYAKLQQTLAPHSEWMAKLAQKMPTVDPAVLENLQKSKAAIEAAMAEQSAASQPLRTPECSSHWISRRNGACSTWR
jgi:hypothetical protein